ncbi:MAG: hypothetical protein HOQ17_10340 [Gemmatimonadaceae bacterium]|nr:hypothetical protein [Gemmatimonadaceae bacterium]NUS33448.1 hypothetical protein [Gemmatimonadaceae bacterium]
MQRTRRTARGGPSPHSYLKLSTYRVGLLINFRVVHLKDGIRRLVDEL